MNEHHHKYFPVDILCHNVEGSHDIKCCQKQMELNFSLFQRLGSNFNRGSYGSVLSKEVFLKISQQFQSLFLSCNFIKKGTPAQGFPCEFCKIFKNIFLQNTSRWLLLFYYLITVAAFILCNYKQFRDLDFFFFLFFLFYFFIIIFFFLIFILFFSFTLRNACLTFELRKSYSAL